MTLFSVWDRERQCWAGIEGRNNERSLEEYALDEFKDAHLVYCDMEGWALADDGTLLLVDECGNFAYADPARYEVRFDPTYLERLEHASAERWRARALKAESDPHDIRNRADELARLVIASKQNVGNAMRGIAIQIRHLLRASEQCEEVGMERRQPHRRDG